MSRVFGVGVVGLGVMGRTHLAAWRAAEQDGLACTLVAVCDQRSENLSGRLQAQGNLQAGGEQRLFDPAQVLATSDFERFLAAPGLDLVSVCTTTETHVALAERALRAGKHVLVEKPVALDSRAVQGLIDTERASGRLCMPAFCMRFWPGWVELLEAIRDARYGAVVSAVFQRLAAPPAWSTEFYSDQQRSGGALFDLHIHDVDFIHAAFGAPDSLLCSGSLAHVTTLYRYAKGPRHVVAEGGWDHSPGFGFRMRYVVVFERATLDFDIGREPRLLLCSEGRSSAVPLAAHTGYDGEVRSLLASLLAGASQASATLQQALVVTRTLEAERQALPAGA